MCIYYSYTLLYTYAILFLFMAIICSYEEDMKTEKSEV